MKLPDEPGEQSSKIISWRHVGYGHKRSQNFGYGSERVSADAPTGVISKDAPDPRQPFTADLGGGISCVVPLALYTDANGTLPRRTSAPLAPSLYKFSAKDRTTRLAAVAQAWNVLQHFYPYFDVVQTDWKRALAETLLSAATDSDELTFLRTMKRMLAQLKDGHGFVGHLSRVPSHTLPVVFAWIENQVVVTSVAPEGAEGLQPGDIVLKIDDKPILTALAEEEALVSSATPQWKRYTAVTNLRVGTKDSESKLEVLDAAGKTRAVALRRTIPRNALTERQTEKIAEIRPGIFYVDLDRATKEDFQNALPKLAAAKGIVFDIRGYPKVPFEFMTHLTDKPLLPPRFLRPIITKPDRTAMTFPAASDYALPPSLPRLMAKMAFITDGRAISYAESVLGIVENYKIAEIVGETTAGTNGNINPFDVLGNYRIVWTGMKVLKHDGSPHHGVGIKPTVPVSRTIQGVREKRDEQLEKAISVVRQ
jgi:C-terminal processing protease CtpA/Prc